MKDKLEQRFKELEGQFDIEEPKLGHFNRFEVKLTRQTTKQSNWNPNTWKWLLGTPPWFLVLLSKAHKSQTVTHY